MAFANGIKIGRPTKEISFATAVAEDFDTMGHTPDNFEAVIQGWSGRKFRRILGRYRPGFRLHIDACTEATVQQMESLRRIADSNLAFIWAAARQLYSEKILSTDTLHLTMPDDSITLGAKEYAAAGGAAGAIMTIGGVFTDYSVDGTNIGTNYYAGGGGSYDPATRIITLDNPLPGANVSCYVNWHYNGLAVQIPRGGLVVTHTGGHVDANGPRWDVQLTLEGA